ncbi:sugar phosphate isomerase/epimerase family protein [Fonticella tunisiensis]|uniref:D-erythrulose 1-phosphate dehydrogenase n=1 Tax=Fonticella tunisiensis TaxID=1096341 RepID=A0A4R7K9C2_9CLOT|nr:TIM barrel protein [Fonticella tunisiensis]TDT50342.1 D-erythrulose 1-phosphate dehydrogenase [Fonticella tunisiensis]
MDIKLGMNTSFALNRFPLPKEWIDIVTDELELKYVQFYFDLLDPVIIEEKVREKICEEIREYSMKKGIEIVNTASGAISHQTNFLLHPDKEVRKSFINWYRKAIDETAQMGSKSTGVYVGAFSMADIQNEKRKNEVLNDYINIMGELSDYASQKGLEYLLIEPMSIPREYPCTIEESLYINKKLNSVSSIPIYLNLDVGHLNILSNNERDRDPISWIKELLKYTKILHIQQTDKEASRHWPFTEEYNKKGIIDGEKILDAVCETGVDEIYLIMELFYKPFGNADYEVIPSLKESVRYWKNIINKRVDGGKKCWNH